MSTDSTDQHLNEVALKQMTWKPGPLRDVACLIAEKVAVEPFTIWPDEIVLASISSSDRNCVGSAWRLLTKAGVIKPTASSLSFAPQSVPQMRRCLKTATAVQRNLFFREITVEVPKETGVHTANAFFECPTLSQCQNSAEPINTGGFVKRAQGQKRHLFT